MKGNWASSIPVPWSQTKKAHRVSARAEGGHFASKCLWIPVQRALTRLAGLQRDILLPNKHNILLFFKSSLCQCPLAFHRITGVSIYAYSSSFINSLSFSAFRSIPLSLAGLSRRRILPPKDTIPSQHVLEQVRTRGQFLAAAALLLHNPTPPRDEHLCHLIPCDRQISCYLWIATRKVLKKQLTTERSVFSLQTRLFCQ